MKAQRVEVMVVYSEEPGGRVGTSFTEPGEYLVSWDGERLHVVRQTPPDTTSARKDSDE